MKVWQVHKILADAVGDGSKNITVTTITDGVRFSKDERDTYLYRGMIDVMNKRILALKGRTPHKSLEFAYQYFPTSVKQQSFPILPPLGGSLTDTRYLLDATGILFSYIFTARVLKDYQNNTGIPTKALPAAVRTHLDALRYHHDDMYNKDYYTIEYARNENATTKESWVFLYSSLATNIDLALDAVELIFLEQPKEIKLSQPNDNFEIDEMHINEVIASALQFMLIDHQDLEISPQFIQLQEQNNNLFIQPQMEMNDGSQGNI
jgi:hypothetical protein